MRYNECFKCGWILEYEADVDDESDNFQYCPDCFEEYFLEEPKFEELGEKE